MTIEIVIVENLAYYMQKVSIVGDGACLFRSLSYLLHGDLSDLSTQRIRKEIVAYVVNHWGRLQVLTDNGVDGNYCYPEEYAKAMLRKETYGSAAELTAAAEMYGCLFRVFKDRCLYYTFGNEGAPVKNLRFSGDLSKGHFDVYQEVPDPKLSMKPAVVIKPISKHNVPNSPPPSSFTFDNGNGIQDDPKLQFCPVVMLHRIDSVLQVPEAEGCNINAAMPKRTKRRGKFSSAARRKQLRDANAKYRKKHPEVNRVAVSKYTKANPEVHRVAVSKYTKANPEVNIAAVARYDPTHEKRVRRRKLRWLRKSNSGFSYNPEIAYESDKEIIIGKRDDVCGYCNARKWKGEAPGLCCNGGKVHLTPLEKPPEPLFSLLVGDHPESEHFLQQTRKYNKAFQMTSFGAHNIVEGHYMPTFKVQGQVYHLIGSVLPTSGTEHKFLQIYFVGEEEKESDLRCANVPGLHSLLVRQLQRILHECNAYVRDFKAAIDTIPTESEDFQVVIHADKRPVAGHPGRFNTPVAREVGIVIVGQTFESRDVVLRGRDNRLKRIRETHRSYDALQYPLMFCYGEDGYSVSIPQVDPERRVPLNKSVSAAAFYAYRLMARDEKSDYLLYFRGLLNQFLVDMCAKIETERLNFLRHNQKKLRAEQYIHLQDAVRRNDANLHELGQVVILPSSFTGGPRYMHERSQDAMTYVRLHGRPDLFITFTCNPKWNDIVENLLPGQKAHDRHDLVSRIFHLKVKKMMHLLTRGFLFGGTTCYMYTIEWQKRGLPHVHILLWLNDRIKPEMTDSVISAEIPDPASDPTLYDIVRCNMIHGPCGVHNMNSTCMVDGTCSKKYPRPFVTETQTGLDGYPLYRRRAPRDGGQTVEIRGVQIDNRWVVPYSPVLSRTFNAHINVELCNSIKSIKYVCSYINKGSDQAVFRIENEHDEISSYEAGRYISSSEAAWHIFCFPIHERYPPVVNLSVHLENGQRVYFTACNVRDRVENPPQTTLLAFFNLCRHDNFAKQLLYCEVPAFYVWRNQKFMRRKRGANVADHPGVKKDNVLGRVYTVHPNNSECYHLRLLLNEVRGPTCFEDLKTVDGVVHPTFKEACLALGLLEDDEHWDHALADAALAESPQKIRRLFAIMLVFCQLSNPEALWEKHKDSMAEDIKRHLLRQGVQTFNEQVSKFMYNRCLMLLEDCVLRIGERRINAYGLPAPSREIDDSIENREFLRHFDFNAEELHNKVAEQVPLLNSDQKDVYSEVTRSMISETGTLFFLDAPGGTGKTFLLNLLLATVRMDKKIAIAVASSGIAATLLEGGKTAHSAFKLPLDLNRNEAPMCNISRQGAMAHVLRECKLVVWDECTMTHKRGVEALDRTLQDIRNNTNLMGGMTVLLAGDFRQTLPVIPRGTRADEVKACFKSSHLWPKVKVLSLRINMRVHLRGDLGAGQFSDLLMKIGNGNLEEDDGKIIIPETLCELVTDLQTLTEKVYPEVHNLPDKDVSWLKERAILTPTNEATDTINSSLLENFVAEAKTYKSVDSTVEVEDTVHYPVEFLNSLNPPGVAQHKLLLKVGAPIMLLRNLQPPKLCNGTRLQVKSLLNNLIEAVIFTGCGTGESVFIPRIPLTPSDSPFQFKRLQFPVRVCFAMTINKAQGQSLKVVGVDLRRECFSHGQLYVACSRVSSPDSLFILKSDGRTKNVVYKEVLRS